MTIVWLLVGFVLLIKGADYFVEGSSNIARLLHVSPLLIGLTIVAFGTSAPEATVSILAAVQGNADVAIGNVVGSNIFNISLAIGITAIIYPIKVESTTVRKEIPFTLLTSIALYIMISDSFLQGSSINILSRPEGILLLLFLIIFMNYIFEVASNNREQVNQRNNEDSPPKKNIGKLIALTLLGLVAIIYGGHLVVTNSTELALAMGMSETLVGLTIVAIGTSLPELVTSITAAFKKHSDIAIGNVVGSNIFNILFVLGTTATISDLQIDNKIFLDMAIMIGLTVILLIFSRTQFTIGKREGVLLSLTYIIYVIYIIIRN